MSAYQSMRFDDLRQREANGEKLTPKEQRELNTYWQLDRKEWERAEQPHWLGGDYPDVF
jgi:hypothetical protein